VYNNAQVLEGSNNGWSTGTSSQTTALTTAFAATQAFSLTPGSLDSALIVGLAPGTYTVQATPAAGSTTGTVLVEVYEYTPAQ